MLPTVKNILDNFIKLKSKDKVLLIKDRIDNIFIEVFVEELKDRKIVFKEVLITENRNHSSPIPEVIEELSWADVVIAPTTKSVTHSPEIKDAKERGARIVTMPGITEEVFLKINKVDFEDIYKSCKKILKQVINRDRVEITSKNGTDISFSVKGRQWQGSEIEEGKGFARNLPVGEVYCAPVEDSASGTIFIERFENLIMPRDKAWVKVKNGKITKWNSGAEPFIKQQSVDNGLIIGEFGIGLNKEHKTLMGNTLHDEKIHGSVHIAFGNNTGFGGKNKSSVHEDLIIMSPTVLIDGKNLKW